MMAVTRTGLDLELARSGLAGTLRNLPPRPPALDAVCDVVGLGPNEKVVRMNAQRYVAGVPDYLPRPQRHSVGVLVDPAVNECGSTIHFEVAVGDPTMRDHRSGPEQASVQSRHGLLSNTHDGLYTPRYSTTGRCSVSSLASVVGLAQACRYDEGRSLAVGNRAPHVHTLVQGGAL